MEKFCLIVQHFSAKSGRRQEEIDSVLKKNCLLGFDEIIVIHETNDPPPVLNTRIIYIFKPSRITYSNYLEFVFDPKYKDWNLVFANADIEITEDIFRVAGLLKEKTVLALTRYEPDGTHHAVPHVTQDTWIMKGGEGNESLKSQAGMQLGRPGCENRFAELLVSHGYQVYNPFREIKTIHHHLEETKHEMSKRLFGLYCFPHPCSLLDIGVKQPIYSFSYMCEMGFQHIAIQLTGH